MSEPVTITGVDKFNAALEKLIAAAEKTSDRALPKAVAVVRAETGAQFGAGKAPKRGDTGRLEQSVQGGAVTRTGFGVYEQQVGPAGLAYVRITELGKQGGRRRRIAHPFFEPGWRASVSKLGELFRHEWEEAITHG